MSLHDCATEHPAVPDSEAPTSAAIWQPIALAGRQLSNRLAVAPMSRVSTRGDGVPTAAMVHYYRRYAGGGFGSVITEGIYPIGPGSQGYPNQPGLVTAEQVQAWAAVTSAYTGREASSWPKSCMPEHYPSIFAPPSVPAPSHPVAR